MGFFFAKYVSYFLDFWQSMYIYVFVKFNTVCEHKKRGGRVGHDERQDPPECEIQDENENYSRGSV